jgi:hypothetical protein
MTRTFKLTLVLSLLLCSVAAVAMAADAPQAADNSIAPAAALSTPAAGAASAPSATAPLSSAALREILLGEGDPDCEAACYDGFTQCCTYGGCEQCSCQLAICRATECGDPYYGC